MRNTKKLPAYLLPSALILALALALCACTPGAKPTPTAAPTEDPSRDPELARSRVELLAELCRDYGEFDYTAGVRPADAERMIYLLYRYSGEESELSGYTKVNEDEALHALAGVFPSMEIPEFLRTKYDQSGTQEVFFLNGSCYVLRGQRPGRTVEVVDITLPEGSEYGSAFVKVADEGSAPLGVKLTLVWGEEGLSVTKCEYLYYD